MYKYLTLALPLALAPLMSAHAEPKVQEKPSLESAIQEIKQQRSEISEQKKKIALLESKYESLQKDEALDSYRGTGLFKRKSKKKLDQVNEGSEENAVDEAVGERPKPAEKPPEVAAIKDEGGAMLPPGTLVIEPGIDYSRSSALRVAIEGFTIVPALNIGAFDISEVDRDTFTANLGARIGVTNRIEAEMSVPYIYRHDSTVSRPIGSGSGVDVLNEVDGDGLGDLEGSVHYQINRAKEGWPFFIGNLRFKSITGKDPFDVPLDPITGLQLELPTGSGFYSLQPSLTAIFPSDPVVFYTNLGYLINFERDIGGTTGKVNPGDSISLSFGMGFSVNEKASFSMGYSHSTVLETERNGVKVPTSDILQVGQMNFGYAYKLNKNVNLNLSIGAGLTDDAPDMSAGIRVPIAFNLLK